LRDTQDRKFVSTYLRSLDGVAQDLEQGALRADFIALGTIGQLQRICAKKSSKTMEHNGNRLIGD